MHIEVAFYSADFSIVHLWLVVSQYGNMAGLRYSFSQKLVPNCLQMLEETIK